MFIQRLNFYRHSLAMRFLDSGATYEDVARILGDTVATIETHYSELGFTPYSEKHGRQLMLAQRCRQRMERLSQNDLIGSEKFGLQITTRSESTLRGVRTPDWWRTYQDSNPGFQLRRLE